MSIEPTSEQLKILRDGKYYSDERLGEKLGVATETVPLYREYYRLLKGKKVYIKPPDSDLNDVMVEMKALVKVCEVTDNPIIRKTAKERLRILSQIPIDNEWSLEALMEKSANQPIIVNIGKNDDLEFVEIKSKI